MKDSIRKSVGDRGYDQLKAKAVHPGLWFDRYLQEQPEKEQKDPLTPYSTLVSDTADLGKPAIYNECYERWKATLAGLGVKSGVAKVTYRLASGHGVESPIETGIFLHHSYGVPYIPGSSLKGVAAAYAEGYLDATWKKKSDAYNTLFGTTMSAGYVTFFDALPVPGDWHLLPDVITVHHPKYYQAAQGEELPPPADWDDPTPISFLSATGSFLIALLPSPGAEAWADVGYELLKMALAETGVGGKTSSGYGRMTMV